MDLGLRIYNPKTGRMTARDPRAPEYPWQSPYVYHRNSPIWMIDFMGGGDGNNDGEKKQPQSYDDLNPLEKIVYNFMMAIANYGAMQNKMAGKEDTSLEENLERGVNELKAEALLFTTPQVIPARLPKVDIKGSVNRFKGLTLSFRSNTRGLSLNLRNSFDNFRYNLHAWNVNSTSRARFSNVMMSESSLLGKAADLGMGTEISTLYRPSTNQFITVTGPKSKGLVDVRTFAKDGDYFVNHNHPKSVLYDSGWETDLNDVASGLMGDQGVLKLFQQGQQRAGLEVQTYSKILRDYNPNYYFSTKNKQIFDIPEDDIINRIARGEFKNMP